jgi:hypothetical protein
LRQINSVQKGIIGAWSGINSSQKGITGAWSGINLAGKGITGVKSPGGSVSEQIIGHRNVNKDILTGPIEIRSSDSSMI